MAIFKPNLFHVLAFLSCTSCCFCVLRPRGVPLSKKIFYNPNQNFSCLDGSGSFPFYYVNDDFCDCEDGSDEPGTPACENGIFICSNHGYLPMTLPSSRVNDAICDCCDASDEYNSTADCLNICREVGLVARNAAQEIYNMYMKGNETRKQYIAEAKERKQEYEILLARLLSDEKEALKIKHDKQDLKEKAVEREQDYLGVQKKFREEQERRRMNELKQLQEQKEQEEKDARIAFAGLDLNKDGKVTVAEVRSFKRFDYDGDGKVSEKEAKFYTHKREELTLDEFIANGWNAMKPAFTIEESGVEESSGKITPSAPTNIANVNVMPTPNMNQNLNEKERNAVFAEAAARQKDYANANKVLQDIQVEIWNVKKKLKMDFGPENEFLILEDQCFDFSDKRYIYRLCPFDRAVQIFKHNRDETLLGVWNDWSASETGKYSKMSYTRGSVCWNGPPRSLLVNLQCGLENRILSVAETTTCSYVFDFATPSSCKDVPDHVQKILNSNLISF